MIDFVKLRYYFGNTSYIIKLTFFIKTFKIMELLFLQPTGPPDPVPNVPIDSYWIVLVVIGFLVGCYLIRQLIDIAYREKQQRMKNKIFENFEKLSHEN